MVSIIAFITRHARYRPEIEWSSNSWTHNIFRAYEMVFGRRCGIRCEASTSAYKVHGKLVIVKAFYTWEASIAHVETMVRGLLRKPARFFEFVPNRVFTSRLAMTNGMKIPTGYMFAIAFDATVGKREASGATPNTVSHTCTGSDRHLWVNTSTFTNDVLTCAYNSVAVGAVSGAQIDGVDASHNGPQLRVLIAPTTGANNLVTTDNGSGSLAVAIASYSGCNQTTATDGTPGTTGGSGTTLTVTMTVPTASSWVIAGMNNAIDTLVAGAGTTMRQNNLNYGLADSNGVVATGSQSLVATHTNGSHRGAIATILVAVVNTIKTWDGLAVAFIKTRNGLPWPQAVVATFGYWAGGLTSAGVVTTDKLDFSTDTTTMVTKAALLTAKFGAYGLNSSTLGYFAGGRSGSVLTENTSLSFASDTTTQVTKGVMSPATHTGGFASSTVVGYSAGGHTTTASSRVNNTQGLTFSTDTTTMTTRGALTSALASTCGTRSATVAYFAGGSTGADVVQSINNGLTFSTDTTAMVTKGALGAARTVQAGSNSTTVGYNAGGQDVTTANSAITYGLTFSTDTTTQVTKGALTAATGFPAGASSLTSGYHAGGNTGTNVVTNNGLTFATDTTTMVTKGSLSQARYGIASVSTLTP